MNSELEQKILNHTLTYEDLVVGKTLCDNPKFNPEIYDYVYQIGTRPKKFWDNQKLENISNLGGYRDYFHSYYYVHLRKRKVKHNER